MHPSPEFTTPLTHVMHSRAADRAYQSLTIAAMIVLLGTLWAF